MPDRPTTCAYCHGTGRSDAANECGFCDEGVPLDTQEDWDRTWGSLFERHPMDEDHIVRGED